MNRQAEPLDSATLIFLWLIVMIELLSPIPGVLTLGAIWVLFARPVSFRRLVDRLYADRPDG